MRGNVDSLIERMDDMKYCDFCRAILLVYWQMNLQARGLFVL